VKKKAYLFLAEGFEEVEAITPLDYLRRAGVDAVSVSISKEKTVCGAHKISICADTTIFEINPSEGDCVVLPGGMPGAANLAASKELDGILREYDAGEKLVCAICAAPAVVLGPKDMLQGRRFTCYPGLEARIQCCADWSGEKVVADEHIITSRGPGTAAAFSLKIIEKLLGKDAAKKIETAALLSPN
jgi:4-methyl-5(b-hydroxyethyl)-thiazole monophosphate biosynthesis